VRVLVNGYYGFGNTGDEALLEGLLRGLTAAGHEPRVLSADPAQTAALHGVLAFHRLRSLPAALSWCEAFVSGGGGLLQDRSSRRSLRYYLLLIRVARALGKSVVVYGQSIGPLSGSGRRRVAAVLRGVPIAVRDTHSVDLLAGLGLTATLVGDPALLLDPPSGPIGETGTILVPRAGHPDLTDALAAVGVDSLESGLPVALLPFHPEEDGPEVERLRAALPSARLLWPADHREVLRLISGARLVVSARLHGLILSAAAGTPFVGLVYDPKVAGFLAQSGGIGFEAPVDQRSLVGVCRERCALTEEARRQLVQRAEDGLVWLDEMLAGRA
jgi:polysaccharide pyruvyl transferase CsaB